MTRTGVVPAPMAHTPEPRLSIHPADAERIGLVQDAFAHVVTADGQILLRADLRHSQRRGETFVPMHWTDAFTAAGPIGQVVAERTDPHSGQPALKSTPASVAPVTPRFHGQLLRRTTGVLPDSLHWVRVPTATGQVYHLTGLTGIATVCATIALALLALGSAGCPASADAMARTVWNARHAAPSGLAVEGAPVHPSCDALRHPRAGSRIIANGSPR